MRDEIDAHQRRAAELEAERLQHRLTRRARSAAWAHAVVWGAMGILYLANTGRGSWVTPFVVVVLALEVGLVLRRRIVFFTALAIDASIVVAAFGWAFATFTVRALVGAVVIAVFPALFGALLWAQRHAFRAQ